MRIEAQVKLESASGGREVDTDSPVDCTPATDMLDVTRLPNGRMLDVEDGMLRPTLFLLIPFANGCSLVFMPSSRQGAAQWCCPSTQGIEARRMGVCVVAAKWGQSWVSALEQEGLQLGMCASCIPDQFSHRQPVK